MSLPDTASANTLLFIPAPSADQLLPSHLAMFVAALPPAVVKKPPAYTSLPDTASANTSAERREPNASQPRTAHLPLLDPAMPAAVVPPAPAYTPPPDCSHPVWRCHWLRRRPPPRTRPPRTGRCLKPPRPPQRRPSPNPAPTNCSRPIWRC